MDAWHLSAGVDGRALYPHFWDEYWEFWRFNEESLRFSHIVQMAALFEKKSKTINFSEIRKELRKYAQGADFTTIDRLLVDTKANAEGLAIIRSNAFAHRSMKMSYDDAFVKADLSFDKLYELSEQSLSLVNAMLNIVGSPLREFSPLPLAALERLASDSGFSNAITRSHSFDRLDNVHPGDILRYDYMIGSDIPVGEVVSAAGIAESRLLAILDRRLPVDAATDLRLSRYFGVSEGMFVGLQADYDIEEAKRALNGSLDRIVPRAA